MHRTVIPIEMKNIVRWHEWADGAFSPSSSLIRFDTISDFPPPAEYDLVVPSTPRNESNWRSAAWSPSGLSGLGRCARFFTLSSPSMLTPLVTSCVLATLTVVGEVLLFAPSKDAAKGEWSEVRSLTSISTYEADSASSPDLRCYRYPDRRYDARRSASPSLSTLKTLLTAPLCRRHEVQRANSSDASGSDCFHPSLPNLRSVCFFAQSRTRLNLSVHSSCLVFRRPFLHDRRFSARPRPPKRRGLALAVRSSPLTSPLPLLTTPTSSQLLQRLPQACPSLPT